jgi:hypothetical protein
MTIIPTEQQIDEALEDTFPASDPPSFIGAGAKPGSDGKPPKRRSEFGPDFGDSPELPIRRTER